MKPMYAMPRNWGGISYGEGESGRGAKGKIGGPQQLADNSPRSVKR